ncbi:hypothetical protein C1631_000320 [Chryseobacterium phosphatilyticum]|uniref:Uncharacterized protein n=1 Tax=Chryseobacterium phosphatilyticum TaxID=475075 RepID=A0A316XI47_9FLAO|nr:hypothetical protein [Chryseobacterium phosphatilyticum]PWN71108.1 hypothetical protein C1631_000320 [Chryseobacterium phosphatilyticum]
MNKKKQFIKVHPHSFHRILEAVKEFEKENNPIQVGDILLSDLLIKASDFSISKASIPNEVKTAILKTNNSTNTDPSTLEDNKSMSEFGFGKMQYRSLTIKLNRIANGHNTSTTEMSIDEVKSCGTVKDCISLVTKSSGFSFNQIPSL